ncbi:MAG: ATP-binding cassette domain-containing protein [Deltaproteobacteria bacterium]|nr:ATP-binding cassette domain-containing protein [Deltaproteobacteria bacterium]
MPPLSQPAALPVSAAPPLIEMADVHLTLTGPSGPVKILAGIDLQVAPGETLSVAGPSGSGKTTLLMVMAGLEKATSGRVLLAGQDLGRLDEDALARLRRERVGVVFQSFHLVSTMTARENVALPLEFAGRDDAWEEAAQGLAAVGLTLRQDHYPSQLSGGEQQRVAIARALAARPALLLADEPTGNLDQETGRLVADLLFSLAAASGAALVLVTHDPALAVRCRTTRHMLDGRLRPAPLPGAGV